MYDSVKKFILFTKIVFLLQSTESEIILIKFKFLSLLKLNNIRRGLPM